MDEAIRALAEPRRRRILELVADRELSAGQIASKFDVTRPAISQHLTILKEAGLVDERREGTRRLYRTRPEGFAEMRTFLERFWDEGLERLRLAAELEEGRRRKRRGRRAA
jgi:DNA-binding transcriptional ArsR family regulator